VGFRQKLRKIAERDPAEPGKRRISCGVETGIIREQFYVQI